MNAIDPLDLLERIHRDVAQLRELAGNALVITIAPAPPEPAMKPPPEGETRAPGRSRKQDAQRAAAEAKVLAVLADGPASQVEIADRSGIARTKVRVQLLRLLQAGRVERAGDKRNGPGRPSPVWRRTGVVGAATPDPEVDDPAFGPEEERAETTRSDAAAPAAELTNENARLVVAALEAGPLTVMDLAHATGLSRQRVVAALRNARGRAQTGDQCDGPTIWERVPLPHEQEDVTIRRFDGEVDEPQVLDCLRDGPLALAEIATALRCRPADVSMVMRRLEDAGRAVRINDGKYVLREERAA